MQIHPSDLLLKETFQEPASRCERVSSHVRECLRCQERLKGLLSAYWANKALDYSLAFDRSLRFLESWQRAYARERAEAPSLLSVLLNHPVERQKLLLRNHPRFQTWGLFELLLQQSHEQVFKEASSSEELARLALTLSSYLDSAFYGTERIEDYRARAWSYIGNSLRIQAALSDADKAFEEALRHLRKGTGDSLERANLLPLKASLRRFQGRFDESSQLLRRSIDIFREAGEHHNAGRSLVKLSMLHHVQGESQAATSLLKEAVSLLDPSLEPRDVLCAWHNLVVELATSGRFMEAQGFLTKARPFYRQFPEPWSQSRLKWAEGKILRGFGRLREAKTLLTAAHAELLAANLPFDAAVLHSEIIALPAADSTIDRLA